jgi:hypothetical protein
MLETSGTMPNASVDELARVREVPVCSSMVTSQTRVDMSTDASRRVREVCLLEN